MNPLRLRPVHVLPKQQRPLRRLLHCAASICPQRLFMSPRLGQHIPQPKAVRKADALAGVASRPLQAPARPLAPRGGIWRNPNPFSYFHTFTLPQFHIFTFPTAVREPVRPANLRPSIPHPLHPSALPSSAMIVTHQYTTFFATRARDPLAPRGRVWYNTHRTRQRVVFHP